MKQRFAMVHSTMNIFLFLIAATLFAAPANGAPKSSKTTVKFRNSGASGDGSGPPGDSKVSTFGVSAFETARKAEPGAPNRETGLGFFTYYQLDFETFASESGSASVELRKFKPTLQKGATLSMEGMLELETCVLDFTTGFECSYKNVTFSVDAVWTSDGFFPKGTYALY
jgi:hypothetical protein